MFVNVHCNSNNVRSNNNVFEDLETTVDTTVDDVDSTGCTVFVEASEDDHHR